MPTWSAALVPTSLLVLGLVRIVRRRNSLKTQHDFATEFLMKYGACMKSLAGRELDREAHVWLTLHLTRMQEQLAGEDVLTLKPPGSNVLLSNFQLLPSTLMSIGSGTALDWMVCWCRDVLLQHVGSLEDKHRRARASLSNPIVWLGEGARLVLATPLFVLGWLGVFAVSRANRLAETWMFRALAGVCALATLLAAVMSIVMGWSDFQRLVMSWFRR
jgi:hypothetical protein